jgi:hypothetical protein
MRFQVSLLPDCLDGYVSEGKPVRVVEVFVDAFALERVGFAGRIRQ